MILTPIAPECLADTVAALERQLPPSLRPILRRLTRSAPTAADLPTDHAACVELAALIGMKPLMRDPSLSYSWDGSHVSALSEPSVLLHEVAHFQLASPERRGLPDFGLGAGPETGLRDLADAARRLDFQAREAEEAMASLLGMLWEAELGLNAMPAFQEQNWLEGADRPGTAAFFTYVVIRLIDDGFVGSDGTPRLLLRSMPDEHAVTAPREDQSMA